MNKNKLILALVLLTFFVVSFITNILGPLFPSLIADFNLSLALAGFLPFSFFAAYGVMSIPSGMLVDKFSEKPVLFLAFLMAALGSLLFGISPNFYMAMLSLFLIGTGMAMLQVAINPLLRVVGGEEHFAFYSVSAQLLFGAAGALSPLVYSKVVLAIDEPNTSSAMVSTLQALVPANMTWVSMYWIFALISLMMLMLITLLKFPKVERNEAESIGAVKVYVSLFKDKKIVLFFLAIAAYVGTEQGVANFISIFLQQQHGLDPVTQGTAVLSQFWLMLTLGCVLGLILVKFLDSRLVLKLFSVSAIISLTAGLFGSKEVALMAFPMVGFFLSVMWSVIFSLALNSVPKHHGSVAGILCTGIIGGGLASPMVGAIADISGDLRLGMVVVYITLFYILSVGFWAKPLINNKTINLFKNRKEETIQTSN
ncbi:MFS transporter [Shewanella woodyi]|uniref:Major facilitator superfamily MFS_1 n=1 Tax=Shewanella woodyi (strain ATCC 51908 / MS32) TaxID=392500 RepID=B1KR42_SHEWM|nr:MFS transporter [Shewanella woodyi]ACA84859.1 major facilitator superfamily MFS_1 [Shewanella woodyi ATCC 51908]